MSSEGRLKLMGAEDPELFTNQRLTRRTLLRYGAGAFGGVTLAGLLAACGSGSGETGTTAGTSAGTTTASTGAAPTTSADTGATASGTRGGTMKFALGDGHAADSLDPALQFTGFGVTTGGMIYNNLLHTDDAWNLTPELAEDWEASPDAKRYTFKLRQGIEFHSGKILDANDVAEQYKRILNPDTGSGGLSLLQGVLDPSGIKVPDPSTIVFELKAADAFFGIRTAHYYTRIPQAGTTDWIKGSPGTGPFKSTVFRPGEGAEVVRNENYFQEGLPYLDSIQLVSIPEQATRVEAILNGDVDLSSPPPLSAVPQFESSDVASLIGTGSSSFTFDVDSSIKPYSDPRVSQAMKMLIDREKALQFVVRGTGIVSADSLIDPRDSFYPADLEPYPYDPEQAKALLKEAGYEGGFEVDIWTTQAYPYLNEGAAIGKEAFDAGGIGTTIQSVSNDRYLKAFLNEPIVMDYYLRQHPVLAFDLYYAAGTQNTTRLNDQQINSWVAELKETLDEAKQKELAGEIIKRYNEIAAEIVPFFFDDLWAYKNRVQNLIPQPMSKFEFAQIQLA